LRFDIIEGPFGFLLFKRIGGFQVALKMPKILGYGNPQNPDYEGFSVYGYAA
jgi:hypothetical protein